MTWEPIETAPRDATRILGWVANRNRAVICRCVMSDPDWWDDDDDCGVRPTHWMPLPEGPQVKP